MKQILLSVISTGITTILMHGNTNAQIALNKSAGIHNELFKTEKYSPLHSKVSSGTNIDFRTLKDFRERFTLTNNVTWDVTTTGYVAEFSADSIKTTVAYGKKGNWFYTIHRYNEQKLPVDIRARVKSIYYDYAILNVNEVHVPQEENTIYLLNLQYNQHYKTVRVCGDDMDVIADYHPYNEK